MKVLIVNALFGYKSTGLIIRDLHDLLKRNGHDSHVICINSNINSPDIYQLGSYFQNKIHAVNTRLIGYQGFWSKFSTIKLIQKIENINPDIIHLHNLHSNFIHLGLILDYCARNNKPVILTLHDCWFFTGKCYHFDDVGCTKWLSGCGNCPKKKKDIPSYLYDSSKAVFKLKWKAFRQIKDLYVVGCSNWITEMAKESPILSNAQFFSIYNGVDSKIFTPSSLMGKSKPFTVMVMANKWFLDENTDFRKKFLECLNSNFHLKIVGCNDRILKENTNSEYISYFGYTNNRKELADHYRTSDAFLNITFIDTLPTVNMEAICCGTPVVTYRSGGSPELVIEGKSGYIVEQNDIQGVIKALYKIQDGNIDTTFCAQIGKQNFDKDINYLKYINLYEQIYSQNGIYFSNNSKR